MRMSVIRLAEPEPAQCCHASEQAVVTCIKQRGHVQLICGRLARDRKVNAGIDPLPWTTVPDSVAERAFTQAEKFGLATGDGTVLTLTYPRQWVLATTVVKRFDDQKVRSRQLSAAS